MDNYLENSAKKKGLRCVVVDNSESTRIEDDDLVKAARKVVDSYPVDTASQASAEKRSVFVGEIEKAVIKATRRSGDDRLSQN